MPHRSDRSPHKVSFPQLDREIVTHGDETIFHGARRHGVRIVGACGGRGTCGTCTVLVTEGRIEHADGGLYLAPEDGDGRSRRRKWVRACQVAPRTDCTVEVAPRSLAAVVRAEPETAGAAEVLPLAAAVTSRDVRVAEATLTDTRSDLDRVMAALDPPADRIDPMAARTLPATLRDGGWSARLLLRDGEIVAVAPTGGRTLGLAVDLGTTNAAAFLIDLESGAGLASLGIENPQAAWGADLISRINYAVRGPAEAEELRAAAAAAVGALAHDLCHAVGATAAEIVDVAVCGNTAMHHLLLGLPVRQLGRAPFVAALRDAVDVKARDLGLAIAAGAYVHMAPNVGGFVGSDHVTALLATEPLWGAHGTSLVMDIGTNTEISLIHEGEILSASCPSGPALEGGHISCGMRAAEGAIERVALVEGRLRVETIGGKPPIGLCGSGVLDALASLRRAGLVDAGGRIAAGHPDIADIGGRRAAVLAPGVTFTQHDVRAVQLAKAAIRTGVELLLREVGLAEADVSRFVIAGAFGAYIDIGSGIDIGLFPDLPRERFEQVGNAAGVGVRRILASRTARGRARELAARCRYVELSTKTDFQKIFIRNIGFASDRPTRRAS